MNQRYTSVAKKPLLYLLLMSLFLLSLTACASSEDETLSIHPVAYDLAPITGENGKSDGLLDKFDQDWLMSDLFFLNTGALSVSALQDFLENPPYGQRSWLADFTYGGKQASQIIIEQAHDSGVNPLLLLTRMQVEQSLISRQSKPSQRVSDAALGCGCHDGETCSSYFKGFGNQLRCGGNALRGLFNKSRRDTGLWRAGQSRQTLDPVWVRPVNHATAAMYAYTPWVLRGQGGNWLAWNIMRKFTRFMKDQGMLSEFDGTEVANAAELSQLDQEEWSVEELNACLYNSGRAFVGDRCGCQRDCDFYAGSQQGFCHPAGFCSLSCEGGCPDVLNKAQTFCIADPLQSQAGICVPKASEFNGHCADLPKTIDDERDRFVGNSSSRMSSAEVCAPR